MRTLKPAAQTHKKGGGKNSFDNLIYLLDFKGDISTLGERAENGEITHFKTPVLAIDCEMIGTVASKNRVARCSVVNLYGYVLLDVFVEPDSRVTDYRTRWSGITPAVFEKANASGILWPLTALQDRLRELFNGRIVVGHSVQSDLRALQFEPGYKVRAIDTQKHPLAGNKNGLKNMIGRLYNVEIQSGKSGHSSVEDATASMLLYRSRSAWFDKHAYWYSY